MIRETSDIGFPFDNPKQQKFLQIDEDGRFMLNGIRTTDEDYGRELLNSLVKDEKNRIFVESRGVWALVEYFDEPYIVEMVDKGQDHIWTARLPYGAVQSFELKALSVDEWDRFHGHCENGIPFVFSRKAQAEFFDLVDSFDDDSITVDELKIPVRPWLLDNAEAMDESFWTGIYNTEPSPPFDLGAPAQALKDVCAQLKLNKCRVAVIGAGKGHDAAFFADQGHLVTAFDISPMAIKEAESRYSNKENLHFVLMDALVPDKKYFGQFDLIFEHTCYCAIPPSQRNSLVASWKNLLVANGHVLGVFFAMDKRFGPPFGGSEWELRKRFEKNFRFEYWTRWRNSLPRRLGKEVVIYMQKLS